MSQDIQQDVTKVTTWFDKVVALVKSSPACFAYGVAVGFIIKAIF